MAGLLESIVCTCFGHAPNFNESQDLICTCCGDVLALGPARAAEADRRAIESDWAAVGKDFRSVMGAHGLLFTDVDHDRTVE